MMHAHDCGEEVTIPDIGEEIELEVSREIYVAMNMIVKDIVTSGRGCCIKHEADRVLDAMFAMAMSSAGRREQ
jgi:hypothetical protein